MGSEGFRRERIWRHACSISDMGLGRRVVLCCCCGNPAPDGDCGGGGGGDEGDAVGDGDEVGPANPNPLDEDEVTP